ncbi:MAG: hypothetical protein G01um101416_60 [Microgenomates group bacterium Gr01-1014_16]|nr:MAG: hypothetical protein G01um101416_60 [Microgenomates group bacterium Gr01-1014_16]
MWTNGQRMPTNGNLEPLRDFLISRVSKLVLIDQPHPGSGIVMPKIEEYTENKKAMNYSSSWWVYLMEPFLKLVNKNETNVLFKMRDFLSVIDWGIRDKTYYDYFIGMESINTLAGVILKKLGKINKVIYYVLDYSPNRYPLILNKIYLALDRFCTIHADFVWDVSKAIQPARISAGLDPKKSAPVIHVPIGVYPQQLIFTRVDKRRPFSMCYMGTLTEEQGPDLAIEMMPIILKKYPDATLHIVGGGEKNLDRLKKLTKSLGLKTCVIFHGFVVGSSDMANILSRCYIAVAPYRAIPGSIRQYGDASKLRSYAAAGLPIVTTNVPPLGRELQKLGGAIIAPDNKKGFAQVIMTIFSDRKLYTSMRKQLTEFAKSNTWDDEFSHAFSKS